jgi:hypothetical protein
VRWLVLKGKIDQSIVTLKKIAQINKRDVSKDVFDSFRVS